MKIQNQIQMILTVLLLYSPAFATSDVHVTVASHSAPDDFLKIIFAVIILISTFLSFLIWYRYGKDETVIPVVNFYPPGGINPAEAELVYKGNVSSKGITALIIFLANKGYIKIVEEGKTYSIYSTEVFPKRLDEISKTVMNAINPFNNSFVTKEELRTSYIFNDTCQSVVKDLNNKKKSDFL